MLKLPSYLVNSNHLYVVVIDKEGKYRYVNNTFKSRFSFLTDEFIGHGFLSSIHPDDANECSIAAQECLADPTKAVPVKIRKPDGYGSYFYTEWELSRLDDEDGNTLGIVSVGYDVSPRQFLLEQLSQKEANLAAIINSTSDIHIFVDTQGRIKTFNYTAQMMALHYYKSELTMGSSFYDFVQEGIMSEVRRAMDVALRGDFIKLELSILDENQSSTWYEYSFNPVNDHGHILGVAINGRNIDNRKLTELKILEQNDRLKNIAYEHTHELRGPLSTMMGLIQQMEEFKLKLTDREKEKYLSDLHELAENIDLVIRRIVKEADA